MILSSKFCRFVIKTINLSPTPCCIWTSTKSFVIARFFQIFLDSVFGWTDSFFIEILDLVFFSAYKQDWPDSPGQMDLNPEKNKRILTLKNKSPCPIFGESLFLTSVTTNHGWKLFCLGWKRLETLLEDVIKLPVSNFC